MRLIKLTEKQLREAEFTYLTGTDTPHYDGQSHVSAQGKLDIDKDGKPVDSNDVSNVVTPQSYNRYFPRDYGMKRPYMSADNLIGENADMDGDLDNNGVDDYYEKPELDSKSGNDIVQIPQGVQRKVEILLGDVKRLSPKQQAVVLDKIIEALDLSSLPPSYLKNLRLDVQ